ncbi:MAG TPA: TIGR01777 family oxidoreductase [Candidatus Eisenbacteria bacterium]
MRLLVSGPTGLIGTPLVERLEREGYEVRRLSRSPGSGRVTWDPATGRLAPDAFDGVHGVIHLAGESIAGGRWTPARKGAIRNSRVAGTTLLARTAAAARPLPRFFISASALGYYGDRGDALLDETAPPGTDFLAQVCQEWEAAATPARDAGIRTVAVRTGLVLAPEGGALKEMLLPFRLGVGGPLGNGRQYWSWITLDDIVAAFDHAIRTDTLEGPVNGVTGAVTNRDFTRVLNGVLKRPGFIPAPAAALKIMLGEMAEPLLLASARLVPRRLRDSGFRWNDPELEPALRRLLGRSPR